MAEAGQEHLTPVRVYIEDTDAGGIVYYVNYLKFMERARTELLRELGFEQHALQRQGRLFVVHSVQARYRRPARLDDALWVRTRIVHLSAVSVTFAQTVTAANDEAVLCEAQVKVACVDAGSMRPAAIAAELAKGLERYRADVSRSGEVARGARM